MDPRLLLALLSGVGIAAATGLRAFLPLLALGLAGRAGLMHLRPEAQWLSTDLALWALGVATVLEIAADKIPLLDHALDALGTVLRPIAAWVGTYAVLAGWDSPWAQIAALVFGAGALAVHAVKAKTRLGSTTLTLGHGNPLLSMGEDIASAAMLAAAILAPLIVALVVLVLAWAIRRRREVAPRPPTAPVTPTGGS
jgi:hypothetical protein